jgi:hypothetical protein
VANVYGLSSKDVDPQKVVEIELRESNYIFPLNDAVILLFHQFSYMSTRYLTMYILFRDPQIERSHSKHYMGSI